MLRRLLPLLPLLAACQQEPISYIPQADRTLLQAQARLGEGGTAAATPPARTSVSEMLSRIRGSEPAAPARLVLRYAGTEVLPEPAQREELTRFGAANRGAAKAVVIARPSAAGGEAGLLSQRRALAVARLLEADFREVQLRFEREAPAGQVLVLRDAGTGLAITGAGQAPPR